jgi:tripartite-type tricarboxylate transporter receptor subunit TctC
MQPSLTCRAALKALPLMLGLAGSVAAQAQAWPAQPIRLVVPYTPAGATDVVARLVADRVTADTKWTFVVDNKPGAGGNIGMDAVAKAKADGYTIGLGQTSNLAINPALYARMPYDALKAFTPIAFVAQQPVVVVVNAASPYKTLADLVKAAKAKPGGLTMASAANGTVGHLAGEMLARKAGLKVLNVPYKGAAPAITDLLGGQTDYMFATPQAVLGMVQGGKLRALAVTSAKRISVLPSVPTVAEQGYKGFEAVDWKVIVAPAATPADIVRRLNAAAAKALAQPAMIAKLADEGSVPMSGSPEEVARYIKAEQGEWGTLIREAGIRFE